MVFSFCNDGLHYFIIISCIFSILKQKTNKIFQISKIIIFFNISRFSKYSKNNIRDFRKWLYFSKYKILRQIDYRYFSILLLFYVFHQRNQKAFNTNSIYKCKEKNQFLKKNKLEKSLSEFEFYFKYLSNEKTVNLKFYFVNWFIGFLKSEKMLFFPNGIFILMNEKMCLFLFI